MIFVMSISVYTPEDTKILHTADADFVSRQIGRPVHIVQYDDSLPILAVKLFNDGQAYTIPRNANVNIRLNKPDGTYIYNPALGCSEDRRIVYFEITPQMAAYAGESSPVVEIDYEGSVAASSPIGIVIDCNPLPNDGIESTNEYKSIVKYAREAVSAAASASASKSAAEISENNAKKSEINAKRSEDTAKVSMDASEISKDSAEAAAVRAEAAALAASVAADEAVSIEWSYAVCSEAMGVKAKTISIKDFALATGAKVTIKFQNGNSAVSPTLNVSNTGAKEIYYNGAPVSKNYIKRESVHEFVYDGTHWLMEGEKGAGYSHVTCTTEADKREKKVTLAGFRLVSGTQLILQFTHGNTAENPTLNVQNTGAYPIYYGGVPIPPRYITENSAVQLVFDGQNRWVVVGDFLQQQLDALKRFLHYDEYFWGEKITIVQDEGFAWDYYYDHGSVYPAYKKEMKNTKYAKCTYIPIVNIYDPNEVYKIITYNLNCNDRLNRSSQIGIGYKGDFVYGHNDFTMIGDEEYMMKYNGVIENENGIYIVKPNKIEDVYKKETDMLLFINSWGSPSDIIVYRGNHKVW